jgi:hypothetical protein
MEHKMVFALLFSLSLFTFTYLLQRGLNRKEKIVPLSKSIISGPFFLAMKTRSACLSIFLLLYSALSLKKDIWFVPLSFSTLEVRFFFFETNFVKVLIPFIGVRYYWHRFFNKR